MTMVVVVVVVMALIMMMVRCNDSVVNNDVDVTNDYGINYDNSKLCK